MRKGLLFITIAAAVTVLAGCRKEMQPSGPVFNALMESFGEASGVQKTTLDKSVSSYTVNWTADDRIRISDKEYKVTSASGTSASFVNAGSGNPAGPTYKAFYPYSISSYSDGTVSATLPSEQAEPVSGLVTGFPMYAESSSTTLNFKNLCGLLCLNLKTTTGTASVTSVKLESSNLGLSGVCDIVSDGAGVWKAVPKSSGTSVTLTCSKNIDDSSDTFFHISVPPGNYSDFKITIGTSAGEIVKTSTIDINFTRNRYTSISLTLPITNGHAWVDLGLTSGRKWATMNVGATSVTDISDATKFAWAAASASSWGGSWRLPTEEELAELTAGTYMSWSDGYGSSSTKGLIFFKAKMEYDKGKLDDPGLAPYYDVAKDTHIFLPAVFSQDGHYWSSTSVDAENASNLQFIGASHELTPDKSRSKTSNASVRPVL